MAVVTGQTSTRGLAEFQCGQPCGWGVRFGERGSTATRPAAKTTAGHQRLKPVPYATCRSADDTANKAASRIHDTDPGPLKAHVQEYVMPDNEFLVGVACGAATVLGPGELGTHPGLRHRRRHPDHHAESDDFPPHLEVRTPKGAHREVPGAHPSPDALAASPQI